jgi:predicted DNA-binding helix-hairpin-helix protein
LQSRPHRRLRLADLPRLGLSLAKLAPFITTIDHHPGAMLDSTKLCAPRAKQLELI